MTTARFLIGLLTLALIVVPAGIAGWQLQRCLPARQTALRLLASITISLGLLLLTAELLGAVGWFRPAALVAGSWITAAGTVLIARRLRSREGTPEPEPTSHPTTRGGLSPVFTWVSLAAAAGVATRWAGLTLRSAQVGITDIDSRHYHLPFAVDFARTSWTTRLTPLWPDPVHLFYPMNSELLQALGMITMGRDVLAPVPNLGWLALLLFAGWCAGLRDGVAPFTLLAAATIAGVPLLTYTSGGTALSDIGMLALLMTAIALWRNSEGDLGWIAASGLALGLSVGTKLTVSPTAVALTIAIVALAPAARRRGTLGALAAGLVAGCGFWFTRNLIRTGSPMPSLDLPLFPRADMPLVDEFGHPVLKFLFDRDAWSTVFWPGIRLFAGWAGIIAAVALAPAAWRVIRSKDRPVQALALVALFGLGLYLVVPAGAWGIGTPDRLLFFVNLRYSLPGLLLLFVAGALAVKDASSRLLVWIGGGLALTVAIEVATTHGFVQPTRDTVKGAVAVALLAVVVVAARFIPASVTTKAVGGAAIMLLIVAVAGAPMARRQLSHTGNFPDTAEGRLFSWARTVAPARIGYYLVDGHYPMYGPAWNNELVYVGVREPHGGFRSVADCTEYVRALERGNFDYVVFGEARSYYPPVDHAWTATQVGATRVLDAPPYVVYRVAPPYDPDRCNGAETLAEG